MQSIGYSMNLHLPAKRIHRRKESEMKFIVLFWAILLIGSILVGGYCVQYTVSFWSEYVKGTPVHIPFLLCCGIGLLSGEIAIPAAAITWALSYIL